MIFLYTIRKMSGDLFQVELALFIICYFDETFACFLIDVLPPFLF